MRTRFLLLVLVGLFACAYPRRATHVTPAPAAAAQAEATPEGMWTFEVIDAELPPRKPSGLDWDDDGSGPDPFVRLYIGERMVWESPTVENTAKPDWHATLPRNLIIPKGARFKLEVWDRDTAVTADPMGSIARDGLPSNLLPDARARLTLDTLATVTARIQAPRPSAGVGVEVEIRSDELIVLSVAPYSPAARAGMRVGDRIVAIGPQRVSHMSNEDAFSGLSLASDRKSKLSLADTVGVERDVVLDAWPLWQVM
ncbi:MAG: PDZ domain-containing protein [Myxococcales bacterium]|nr:PDZ domain-containing protein [Myxococcales bacterium]MDD9968038.1 PDZ domain-containing protein [Myxococcales bacterium]